MCVFLLQAASCCSDLWSLDVLRVPLLGSGASRHRNARVHPQCTGSYSHGVWLCVSGSRCSCWRPAQVCSRGLSFCSKRLFCFFSLIAVLEEFPLLLLQWDSSGGAWKDERCTCILETLFPTHTHMHACTHTRLGNCPLPAFHCTTVYLPGHFCHEH